MIDIDKIRKNSMMARDGFYHVVGNHYCLREVDFEVLVAEVERLRGERAAVVAYLRACDGESYDLADDIERGEHRREER
jgi:hypothetical protein